ncbi:MAG: hypothetical protein ACJARK_002316, partial [Marinobacter psychrophilus]
GQYFPLCENSSLDPASFPERFFNLQFSTTLCFAHCDEGLTAKSPRT